MADAAPDEAPSEPGDAPSLAEWAMDVFVYAPVGAMFDAVEDLPQMAAKGRVRIDRELRNARVVGQFAVNTGRRRLQQLAPLLDPRADRADTSDDPSPQPAPAGEDVDERPDAPEGLARAIGFDLAVHGADRDREVDGAITDYDTLSASQVVRRLDGLSPEELAVVIAHESSNRGRRTILHRASQLLGTEPPPAPLAAPGT